MVKFSREKNGVNQEFTPDHILNLPTLFLYRGFQLQSFDALIYEKNFMYMNISWDDLLRIVRKFTLGLLKLGLQEGDKILIISKSRYESRLIQFSILCSGAVCIPLSSETSLEEMKEIVSGTNGYKPNLFFIENETLFEKYS